MVQITLPGDVPGDPLRLHLAGRKQRLHGFQAKALYPLYVLFGDVGCIRITGYGVLQAGFPEQVKHRPGRTVGVVLYCILGRTGELVLRVKTGDL